MNSRSRATDQPAGTGSAKTALQHRPTEASRQMTFREQQPVVPGVVASPRNHFVRRLADFASPSWSKMIRRQVDHEFPTTV